MPDFLLAGFSEMIRVSTDWAARQAWDRMGGTATMKRMKARCGVTDVVIRDWAWSLTGMSARDSARLGVCIGDGRAAGTWTGWVLNEMRHVHGQGHFGIRPTFPAEHDAIAIKNGWYPYEGVRYG